MSDETEVVSDAVDGIATATSTMTLNDTTPLATQSFTNNIISQSFAAVDSQNVSTADSQSDVEPKKESEVRQKKRCVLEDFKTCSESHLWKLMMSFYDRKGVESWSQGIVPHFITCNTFIGRSYAKVLHGYLKDAMKPGANMTVDTKEPLYIIELGTGSGKFSFYMLKALEEMQNVCDFPFDKIVYVMTDFTENNFKFWQDHPALKRYFDMGRLDAGIYDAVVGDEIKLWKANKTLTKGSCKNPLCIVANYLFDTLYHDIFQVADGVLKEGLVSVGSNNEVEPDPLNPDIIQRLDNEYQYNPITPNYYKEEEGDEVHFQRILNWYLDTFKENNQGASILLPVGAMRALRRLGALSDHRALVISGDKGNNNPEQFVGLMDPHIAVHGSFSLMVNYHAIGAWFTSKGGFALHNPQEEASLKVSCFLLDANSYEGNDPSKGDDLSDMSPWVGEGFAEKDEARSSEYPNLSQAFEDAVNMFGPNDFFVLQKSLKEDMSGAPLRTIVSLLKLGDWEPDVFFKFRDAILNHAPNCGAKLRNDLCRGVKRVWDNYYMMDTDKDIAFEIGRFYYGIREYQMAIDFYGISVETVGDHHVTAHNQGLCLYSLGKLPEALEHFKRALSQNGDYEKAKSWIEKVNKEINKPTDTPASTSQPTEPLSTPTDISNSTSGIEVILPTADESNPEGQLPPQPPTGDVDE